jgi:hypothetical protein
MSQIFTAIGTVGALGFIGWQAWSTKEQLKILKDDFLISKRPWIYRDSNNSNQQNYALLCESNKERYVRVPFINQGRFHSSSVTYFHRYFTSAGLNQLYQKTNIDETLNSIDERQLSILKSDVKNLDKVGKRYKVRGPRVIVPGATFGKRFYLTKNPMDHYSKENPNDSNVIDKYDAGEKVYLVILIEYLYDSSNNCEYGGIFTLENSRIEFRNDYWLKEWVI